MYEKFYKSLIIGNVQSLAVGGWSGKWPEKGGHHGDVAYFIRIKMFRFASGFFIKIKEPTMDLFINNERN